MAFPEDPYAESEIYPQSMIEAYDAIEAKVTSGERSLSVADIARLSREAARANADSDMSGWKDMAIKGVQLYDTRKVSEGVKAQVQAVLEANAELDSSDDPAQRRYIVDVFTSRGRRPQMEDKHVIFPDLNSLCDLQDYPPQAFYGVYDGHGGAEAAKYAMAQLHHCVVTQPMFRDDPVKALEEGFLKCDREFVEKSQRDCMTSGATAVVTLIRGRKLYVAWAGDSQAMLCRDGEPQEIMVPHKPEHEDEKQRITDAGGVVVWYGTWRVNGVLAVSRAIGDAKLKSVVVGQPDVREVDLDEKSEFLVLACDGLWDFMEKDKVVAFIKEWRATKESVTGVAKALVEHCIESLASTDNVSIIIVFLENMATDAWAA
eukprot:m.354795 g.354795  ORF g.354795 m.354795 type:complete len:374 (+) comp17104_c0_seq1:488-1609(+)